MSKYDALWESIRERGQPRLTLSFDAVEELAGVPLDHSFLSCKKELTAYGYAVRAARTQETGQCNALPWQAIDLTGL